MGDFVIFFSWRLLCCWLQLYGFVVELMTRVRKNVFTHRQTDRETPTHPHTHPYPHPHPHTHTHPILHATVSGSHLLYYLIHDVVHISLVIRGGLCKLYIVWYILVSSYISFLQLIFIVSIIVSIRAGPDVESKQNDEQEILYFMILYTI